MLVIGSNHFTYHAATKTFSAEASDLDHILARTGDGRLDYRAGQWGFHMQSSRTGQRLWFQRVAEHRDREGDLTYVEFHGTLASGQCLLLKVFND